jgi:hypothetical protein
VVPFRRNGAVLGAVLGLAPSALRREDAGVFEPGRVYIRGELHREWDGTTELQRQGGILTPRQVPLIVVVTGEEGREFGYENEWGDEGRDYRVRYTDCL